MSDTLLSVRDLAVSYMGSGQDAPAVDHISFDIRPGETLGLVGQSGCGKSTTALAILRLLEGPPGAKASGQILLQGRDLMTLDEATMNQIRGREVSMIFQDPMTALDPVFNVGQQLRQVIARHRKLNPDAADALATQMLERMQIADPESTLRAYPHQLSGGMRQRIIIAMALVCQPKVLLADEPTTALDVTTQASILQQLAQLAGDCGAATLLISHDLGVIANNCDRCLVMYRGRIVESAAVDDLLASPSHHHSRALIENSGQNADEYR